MVSCVFFCQAADCTQWNVIKYNKGSHNRGTYLQDRQKTLRQATPICEHVKKVQLDAFAHWGTTMLQFVGYGSQRKRIACSEDTLMDAKWMSEKGLNSIQVLKYTREPTHPCGH